MKRLFGLSAPLVLMMSDFSAATAQSIKNHSASDSGKWRVSVSVIATNAAIKVVDSEIELPEALETSDFEVSLGDDLKVSSRIVSGSFAYRILPFAELTARAGLISSDTETGVIITGTPNGPFSDFFDGPVTVDGETDMDVEGYSLGLGLDGLLPIREIGDDWIAAYSGFQYAWNSLDDGVSSEGAITSVGLLYPLNRDRNKIIYRVGGSYNWISRDIERSVVLNGESLRVRVTQEFEEPWALEAGVGIPLSESTLLGLGTWHQLSGETSFLVSLSHRFGAGE